MSPASAAESDRKVKKCAKCGLDKWLEDFYIAPGTGYAGYCTACTKVANRLAAKKFQVQHRDEYNAYQREYQPQYWKGTRRPRTTRGRLLSDL